MSTFHVAMLAGALLSLVACADRTSHDTDDADLEAIGDGEAGTDDADGDGGEPDATGDGGETPRWPGPLTTVLTRVELSTERLCDLDGDGLNDNAVADLGPPHAELFAMSINSPIDGSIGGGRRFIVHFPWVDDLGGPTTDPTVMLVFEGDDTEVEETGIDLSDDFSGEEPYYIKAKHLDACGEPLYSFLEARLDEGALSAEHGTLPFVGMDGVGAREAIVWGSIGPGGESLEVTVCAYSLVSEVGASSGSGVVSTHTMLEVLVGGGSTLGIPSIPGLSPDVDVDGDGLERVILDDGFHVASCIDGDNTEIPGSDCWADPRIADAFSVVLRFEGVGAVFAGREPTWELEIEDTCETERPLEESLLDPIPEPP